MGGGVLRWGNISVLWRGISECVCRETSCIESHSKSGFASEFKGSGCRPQSLRPWMTWVRILAEVRFFFCFFAVALEFVLVMRVHCCLLSLQRLQCTRLCACGMGVRTERDWSVEGKQWRASVTETGWWKLRSRSDARGSLEEQSVPPLPPQHGYLMTRDHGEALRFSHSAHSTSSFPSYIAIRKTVLHVSAMYVASIKENIKKKAEALSQKSKIYQKTRCALISATLKLRCFMLIDQRRCCLRVKNNVLQLIFYFKWYKRWLSALKIREYSSSNCLWLLQL